MARRLLNRCQSQISRVSITLVNLPVMHQLLPLPRDLSGLFLRFARHPDHRQLPRVAFKVTRQTLAQSFGVARIALHSSALFIQFTWGNDVALRSGRTQLSIESKAKTARF